MDLEKYVEKDIVEFLDLKVSVEKERGTPGLSRDEEADAFSLIRDFVGEVNVALDKGDLVEAANIFKDLKKEYHIFPTGSNDQHRSYGLMEEIYGMMKTYLTTSHLKNLPGSPDELGVILPERPKGLKETYYERRDEQIKHLKEQSKRKDYLIADIKKNLSRINHLLDKKDVAAAIFLYENVKSSFQQIPSKYSDVKMDIYDHILTAYYEIKKSSKSLEILGKELQNYSSNKKEMTKTKNQIKEEPKEEVENSSSKEEILGGLSKIRVLIKKKNAREASAEYKKVKKLFSSFNGTKEDKNSIFQDLLAVYRSVRELENEVVNRKQRPKNDNNILKIQDENVEDEINREKTKTYNFLNKGSVKSARLQYDKLKTIYDTLPEGDLKTRLRNELKEIHELMMRIRKNDLVHASKSYDGDESNLSEDIRNNFDLINRAIKDYKIDHANKLFLELQHRITGMYDSEDKSNALRKLDSVRSRLHLATISKEMQSRILEAA